MSFITEVLWKIHFYRRPYEKNYCPNRAKINQGIARKHKKIQLPV